MVSTSARLGLYDEACASYKVVYEYVLYLFISNVRMN